MNELGLFAGAGGGLLASRLLGWRTVCAVELDAHCQRVLAQRQRDGMLDPFPIWDDVRTFDGRPWRGLVDVISGGFPCQDISSAGARAGITGERSGLWREFARIIREVRPGYVFVENSPDLVTRGLGVVLGDLAALGFDARWELATSAPRTTGTASGSWPTPTAAMGAHGWSVAKKRDPRRQSEAIHRTVMAEVRAHGHYPSARIIEWLMGWPQDWTAVEPLETARFLEWLRSHGGC